MKDEYTECPGCEEPTNPFSNVRSMDPDEARSLRNHFEFDRYCEQRELSAQQALGRDSLTGSENA